MSLSATIRQQIISSFRAELAEHVQTLNDGLLALEQQRVPEAEREATLDNLFRAAHSLKGAARAVGVNAIEQLAHALEDVLGALKRCTLQPSAELYTACYQTIDAIQVTQAAYEAGENSPPSQALKALMALENFSSPPNNNATALASSPTPAEPAPPASPEGDPGAVKAVNGNRLNDLLAELKVEAGETGNAPAPANGDGSTSVSINAPQAPPVVPAVPVAVQPAPVQPPAPAIVSQPAEAPPPSSAPQPPATSNPPVTTSGSDETIRVSVSKLDALMAQLSELLVTKIHAEQRLSQVREVQALMAMWQKEWVSVRGAYSRLARHDHEHSAVDTAGAGRKEIENLLEYVGAGQDRIREMSAMVNKLAREYNSDTLQMALVIDGLEDEIKRLRMLPLSTITGSFPRMVRDLAQSHNKQVVLEITGGDVELDKRVLEQIKDPLIHLLRNAVDHGIEKPEKRQALGKPAGGTISLSAEHSGKDVIITVSDDGAGIDVQAIRQSAMRRNVPDAATLSDTEIAELIYHSGFSTSPMITDISGRGVGLDVVRRNLENLGGRIHTQWTAGQGARFILTIPLSLTSSRGLLVRVSDQVFAIPLNAIERILLVEPEEVVSAGGSDTLRFDGRPLTLAYLGDILGLLNGRRRSDGDRRIPVVILAAAERRMAFVVDELINEQEVVIKGLGRQLSRVGGIAGASVMGSGEIVLILQVADLIKLAQRGDRRSVLESVQSVENASTSPARPQRRILVVDDSITTRTLEKNILEAEGYAVQLANDGLEALNFMLGSDLPDLVISDIAMPRLDGFNLTQRLKSEPRTSHLPVILVTSLDSPEDKARGLEVGADAYIVKSNFEQNNLLDTIVQLI